MTLREETVGVSIAALPFGLFGLGVFEFQITVLVYLLLVLSLLLNNTTDITK